MNISTPPSRGLLSRWLSVFAMSLAVAGIGLHGRAHAVAVDSELVLLVDVSQSGLNKKDFETVVGAYASALSNSQVLESIQSGTYGRIAVSLMIFGNSSYQQVGIPWMLIGSAADAAQFATFAGNVNKPNAVGFPATGAAITTATASFGTETGGSSNGFESSLQIIDVAAAVVPNAGNSGTDTAARNGAFGSGVDLINTLVLGKKTTALEDYYAANVIGSTVPGVAATVTSSTIDGSLAATLASGLSNQLSTGISAVPEPGTVAGILVGVCFALIRRRRA